MSKSHSLLKDKVKDTKKTKCPSLSHRPEKPKALSEKQIVGSIHFLVLLFKVPILLIHSTHFKGTCFGIRRLWWQASGLF